jgi:hypothetical protein
MDWIPAHQGFAALVGFSFYLVFNLFRSFNLPKIVVLAPFKNHILAFFEVFEDCRARNMRDANMLHHREILYQCRCLIGKELF